MINYQVCVYNINSNEDNLLLLDSRGLLLVRIISKPLTHSFQLSENISFKLLGERSLEANINISDEQYSIFEFENTDIRDTFLSKLTKLTEKYTSIMQNTLTELTFQKSLLLKYNCKDGTQSKTFFWISSDLSEIRWTTTKKLKKYSKVSLHQIRSVVYGPQRRIYKGHESDGEVMELPYHLCFSIQTAKKNIDLQAMDEKQLKVWLSSLSYILELKRVDTENKFTINRFAFLRFKLKVSQYAHQVGLTFNTYMRLRINKIINDIGSSSSRSVKEVVPNQSNKTIKDFRKLLRIYPDETPQSMLSSHKRNTTLPACPKAVEERVQNPADRKYFNRKTVNIVRQSYKGDVSNRSSGSNISIGCNNSDKKSEQQFYNTLDSDRNVNIYSSVLEIDESGSYRKPMTERTTVRSNSNMKSADFDGNIRVKQLVQNNEENVQKINNILKNHNLDRRRIYSKSIANENPVNLYYNMDGSKKLAPRAINKPSHLKEVEEKGIRLNTIDSNTEPEQSDALKGDNGQDSLVNYDTEPEYTDIDLGRAHMPLVNIKNISFKKLKANYNSHEPLDKENINPNMPVIKVRDNKTKRLPLNLRNLLNKNENPSLIQSQDSFMKQKSACLNVNNVNREVSRSIQIVKGLEAARCDTMPDENSTSIATSKQNSGFARKKFCKLFIDTPSPEAINKEVQSEESVRCSVQRRINSVIERNYEEFNKWKENHGQGSGPSQAVTNNVVNQSFAYEVKPNSASINLSKIDIELAMTSKSKLSPPNDDGLENQCTSRFKEGSPEEFALKKLRALNEKINKDALNEEGMLYRDNMQGSKSKNDKYEDMISSIHENPGGYSFLDRSSVDLRGENYILKQQLNEARKENDMLLVKHESDRQHLVDLEVMKKEIMEKNMFIGELIKNVSSLKEDKKTYQSKLLQVTKQGELLSARESTRNSQAMSSERIISREIQRLEERVFELDSTNKQLNKAITTHKFENISLRNELKVVREALAKQIQGKDANKLRIFSPKEPIADLSFLDKFRRLEDENSQLKEILERERVDGLNLKDYKSCNCKDERKASKKLMISKLMEMKKAIVVIKSEAAELKKENEENNQNLQEVWPHLVNIFEYQNSQIRTNEAKCFSLSRENMLMRAQLKKKTKQEL